MPKPITREQALERLTSLCSRSEQCESEIVRKLFNWGINSSDRRSIIEYLKENRFIDEIRFARSYTNDKSRFSAWGPYKIRMELLKRKIPSTIITEVLKNVDNAVWKEGIIRCAKTKVKNLDLLGEEGWNNQQKLYKYLISRGFSSVSSSKVVKLMKKIQEEKNEQVD